jgi:hypothetical protein
LDAQNEHFAAEQAVFAARQACEQQTQVIKKFRTELLHGV